MRRVQEPKRPREAGSQPVRVRAYPLAVASNVLLRPSPLSINAAQVFTKLTGLSSKWTPPTTARAQSPAASARRPRWMATAAEEQAVSTLRLGPRSPRAKDRRFATMDGAIPGRLPVWTIRVRFTFNVLEQVLFWDLLHLMTNHP